MRQARSLKNKTIVITGASGGIGQEAALAFAQEEANLILASRSDTLLQELASECESLGARAIAVETDVTDKFAIKNLFETALAFYGSIDVWINNAGVGAVGEFEQTPLDVHEQVLRTNLLGPLYASHLLIPYFKKRQQGILINTNSTGSYVGTPFTAAYSASKFGLRGLTEALRYELKDYKDIHVCDLFSSFVDTPAFQHVANFMGKEITDLPAMIAPERMAKLMVDLVYRPRASAHLGLMDRVARIGHTLMPELTGRILNKVERNYFKKARSIPRSEGNLYGPDYRDVLH